MAIINETEAREFFTGLFRDLLAEELPKFLPEPLPQYLNQEQLAAKLGKDPATVARVLLPEGLPYVLVGAQKRYVLADVDRWLRLTSAEKRLRRQRERDMAERHFGLTLEEFVAERPNDRETWQQLKAEENGLAAEAISSTPHRVPSKLVDTTPLAEAAQ